MEKNSQFNDIGWFEFLNAINFDNTAVNNDYSNFLEDMSTRMNKRIFVYFSTITSHFLVHYEVKSKKCIWAWYNKH